MKIYINHLQYGDKIGVFSPSFPAGLEYPKRTERAFKFLSEYFTVILGELTSNKSKRKNYLSGSCEERAEEFNKLLDECKCLMPIIGGYNSNGILDLIDYHKIKEKKPIIIGYSDSCVICLAIYAKTGIPTFVSQAFVPTYGEFPPFVQFSYKYFVEMLIDGTKKGKILLSPTNEWTEEWINWEEYIKPKEKHPNKWEFHRNGVAKGTLIGGNLDTICSIIGTEYMPIINEDTILMIEETSLTIDQIERNLYILKLHGVFNKIAGLIVSKFENINYLHGNKDEYDIIDEIIGDKPFPILKRFDNGHTHPSTLLPIGGIISIDSVSNTVILETDSVFGGELN